MKHFYLAVAAALVGLSASAQNMSDQEYLSGRGERVALRAARHAAENKRMDSIVLSHGYRFVPDQFQQMPDGMMHYIYNSNYTLVVKPSYTDIDLPFVTGDVSGIPAMASPIPPDRLVPPAQSDVARLATVSYINALMPQVQGYNAVQNANGWTITFQTDAMTAFTYTFTLTITSATQEGVLTISSDQYNSVTYNGNVLPLW